MPSPLNLSPKMVAKAHKVGYRFDKIFGVDNNRLSRTVSGVIETIRGLNIFNSEPPAELRGHRNEWQRADAELERRIQARAQQDDSLESMTDAEKAEILRNFEIYGVADFDQNNPMLTDAERADIEFCLKQLRDLPIGRLEDARDEAFTSYTEEAIKIGAEETDRPGGAVDAKFYYFLMHGLGLALSTILIGTANTASLAVRDKLLEKGLSETLSKILASTEFGAQLAVGTLLAEEVMQVLLQTVHGALPEAHAVIPQNVLAKVKQLLPGMEDELVDTSGSGPITQGSLRMSGRVATLMIYLGLSEAWSPLAAADNFHFLGAGVPANLLVAGAYYGLAERNTHDLQGQSRLRTERPNVQYRAVTPLKEQYNDAIIRRQRLNSVIAAGTGGILGGLLRFSALGKMPEAAASALAVGAVGIPLLWKDGVELALRRINLDPRKNPNLFSVSQGDLLTRRVERSHFDLYSDLMDRYCLALEDDAGGCEARERRTYKDSFEILGGKVFSDHFTALKNRDEAQTGEETRTADQAIQATSAKMRAFRREVNDIGARYLQDLPEERHANESAALETLRIVRDNLTEIGKSIQELIRGNNPRLNIVDVQTRIRDIQFYLLQSKMQIDHEGAAQPDPYADSVKNLATEFAPIFASLRKTDRLVDTEIHIGRLKAGDPSAFEFLDASPFNDISAEDIKEYLEVTQQPAGPVLEAYAALQAKVSSPSILKPGDWFQEGQWGTHAAARILVIRNKLAPARRDDLAGARGALEAAFGPRSNAVPGAFPGAAEPVEMSVPDFEAAFARGDFTDANLLRAIEDLEARAASPGGGGDEESQAAAAATARKTLEHLKDGLGSNFLYQLKRELRPRRRDEGSIGENLLERMRSDLDTMPPELSRQTIDALQQRTSGPVEEPGYREKIDVHKHPTSYSGNIVSFEQEINFMDQNGVAISVLEGIPSQTLKMTPASLYYGTSRFGLVYRDHDFPIVAAYKKLSKEQQERFVISMTGLTVTDETLLQREVDVRLRSDPGTYRWMGEVTLTKEQVSDKNPERPVIRSKATRKLFQLGGDTGLPQTIHCDAGIGHDKDKNREDFLAEVKAYEAEVRDWPANDPLAKIDGVPPRKPAIVWAHAMGINASVREANDTTEFVDRALSETECLHTDLSWEPVSNAINRNLIDQFKRVGMPPDLIAKLDAVSLSSENLQKEGATSDKFGDLAANASSRLNNSALHRISNEQRLRQHLQAQKDFRDALKGYLADPDFRGRLTGLMGEHGQNGNNWLYLMRKHQDRLLFGTDSLAIGTKAHGDAAFASATRMLDPVFSIFDQLGEIEGYEEYGVVSDKIRSGNARKIIEDKDRKKRRNMYEDMLATQKDSEGKLRIRPSNFTHVPDGETAAADYFAGAKRVDRVAIKRAEKFLHDLKMALDAVPKDNRDNATYSTALRQLKNLEKKWHHGIASGEYAKTSDALCSRLARQALQILGFKEFEERCNELASESNVGRMKQAIPELQSRAREAASRHEKAVADLDKAKKQLDALAPDAGEDQRDALRDEIEVLAAAEIEAHQEKDRATHEVHLTNYEVQLREEPSEELAAGQKKHESLSGNANSPQTANLAAALKVGRQTRIEWLKRNDRPKRMNDLLTLYTSGKVNLQQTESLESELELHVIADGDWLTNDFLAGEADMLEESLKKSEYEDKVNILSMHASVMIRSGDESQKKAAVPNRKTRYLYVPVNDARPEEILNAGAVRGTHTTLLVIDFEANGGPRAVHYDSAKKDGGKQEKIAKDVARDMGVDPTRFSQGDIPQQQDGYRCGDHAAEALRASVERLRSGGDAFDLSNFQLPDRRTVVQRAGWELRSDLRTQAHAKKEPIQVAAE